MTDAEAKKFYNSRAWENKRIEILKRIAEPGYKRL